MKVLVTGGAGFIGQVLCKELVSDGHDVICMDNMSIARRRPEWGDFWRHDVCDKWHVDVDQIYHLACPASPVQYQRNPVRTVKTAVLGTLNVLEVARDTGARLLIASTSEIYGDPEVHPQRESYFGNVNPIGERACYDEGKRAGEALAASWRSQYATDVRIARIFNTYGRGMALDDGRLMPNLAMQALRGSPMTVYGDGSQTRSWCYVTDTVSGLMTVMDAVLDSPEVPVFNVGNPDERTVLEVAEAIRGWMSVRRPHLSTSIVFKPIPKDDPRRRCPDISAVTGLGWSPKVHFSDGLDSTMDWFASYGSAYASGVDR